MWSTSSLPNTASSQTPNPCIECVAHIRFDYLLNYARRLGADYLATGHYARLRHLDDGTVQLLRAVDEGKDQSYVLSVMGQEELLACSSHFPGYDDYTQVGDRQLAAAAGSPLPANMTQWISALSLTMITAAFARLGDRGHEARPDRGPPRPPLWREHQGCRLIRLDSAKGWASKRCI
ncbi:MAG: hypothetical protein R2867_13325 [Caldilineaceae bacterium]